MVSVVKWWSTSCLIVVNNRAGNEISIEFCCLFYFGACLPFAKKINHLVCDVNHIVDDIVMINDSVNCLFAVCKLSVWISASWMMLFALFARWLMMLTSCWDYLRRDWWCWYVDEIVCKMIDVVDIVYNLFESCWDCSMWFIICKRVVWMFVNNGWIFYEYD